MDPLCCTNSVKLHVRFVNAGFSRHKSIRPGNSGHSHRVLLCMQVNINCVPEEKREEIVAGKNGKMAVAVPFFSV